MAYELPSDGSGPKRLRTSNVAGEEPVASELQGDEVVANAADGKLFCKDNAGTVKQLGVASTTVTAIVALTSQQYSALDPIVETTLYIITNAQPWEPGLYMGGNIVATYAVEP